MMLFLEAEPCFGISVQTCIFACLLSFNNTAGFKDLSSLLCLLLLYSDGTSQLVSKVEIAMILEFASLCAA